MNKATLIAALLLTSPLVIRAAETADYGKRPSDKEIGALVGTFIRNNFKDPRSLQDLRFISVQAVDVTKGIFQGGGHIYAWQVLFSCNAKNSHGGYDGQQAMYLLVKNGRSLAFRPSEETGWTML